MRDLGRRLIIGLAAAAVVVMVIGYAFIAGRIAAPIGGDLGTLPVPSAPGVRALQLDDGRPAWLVAVEGRVVALDARAPHGPGEPGRLVAWCQLPPTGILLDLLSGATYDAEGRLRGGPADSGLAVYPVREADAGQRIIIGSDGRRAGRAPGEAVALDCPSDVWTVHRPEPRDLFDPSVAADQEPPGWAWLEGELAVLDGEVRLCDGLDGRCATSAPVAGIDPALVPVGDRRLAGIFIGRVRDGAIEELNHVPRPGDAR